MSINLRDSSTGELIRVDGGGGVSDYADLTSKPSINNVELSGNKTTSDLGLLTLGESDTTAYRGDHGKAAYDHSQTAHAPSDATKVESSSTNGNIKINGTETNVYTHPGSGTNPHGTTASDVGAIASTLKGAANGVAELDSNGKVPSSQLPSYVDDVLEYNSSSDFPTTGESGKIYVDLATNKTYRWGGSVYVEISEGLALGDTSSTAFAGNRGKAIEDCVPSGASSSNKFVTASNLGTAAAKNSTNAVTQNSTDLVESGAVYSALQNVQADLSILASEFSTSTAYGVGDYVIYDNTLYRCSTAHSAGAWNASDFIEIKGVGQYVTAGKKANTTLGLKATAEGNNTTASGNYSHAEGYGTLASGNFSHAEGGSTDGYITTASGWCSHAEGVNTTASGDTSHTEGWGTTASGESSHVEGDSNTASGQDSHAEGQSTTASGDNSHAEGYGTTASNENSHAEGDGSIASGHSSHAEGNSTASGEYSHSQGESTEASGDDSHAEGSETIASGWASHAEGENTTASGDSSHAGGSNTIAQRANQMAIGKYNIADTTGSDVDEEGSYAFIIGNGTANNARSNALTVDWSGNVRVGSQAKLLSTQDYVDTQISTAITQVLAASY